MIQSQLKPKHKERAVLKFRELGKGRKNAELLARQFNTSAASIYNWHNQYDGTRKSLEYRVNPNRRIWNKYTEDELGVVKDMAERYAGCGNLELFGRLQTERGFSKSIRTLYRMKQHLHIAPVEELERYIPELYETPKMVGIKWQIDVKWVPACCLRELPNSVFFSRTGYRLYQYTCIDEASRKRFVYLYDGYGKRESIDFIMRCIVFFGYKPLMIQSDNGAEFCEFTELGGRKKHKTKINKKTGKKEYAHPFTKFLFNNKIIHRLIKVATPRHNGKVERSHRTDNQEFYARYALSRDADGNLIYKYNSGFTSLEHARECQKDWVHRYNDIRPMSIHNFKTPSKVEAEMLEQLRTEQGRVTYKDMEHLPGSGKLPIQVEKTGVIKFVKQNIDWALASRPLYEIKDAA